MGTTTPGKGAQRHRLCTALQVAMVLLLQSIRRTHFATGLCGLYANGIAPAGLLLRPSQRYIYGGSERCHCPAAKEFFDARHRDTHGSRATCIAFALILKKRPPGQSSILSRMAGRPSALDYALCVKDLAKRPGYASFERFRFCIVDSTERRAE
jgi:hypothetical protein